MGHPKPASHTKTLFEIKTGLEDEHPQQPQEKFIYAGTDTRDAYHTGWNVSTETINARDSERFLQAS